MLSWPTLTVSRQTIWPICDHERAPHSPKMPKNTPQITRFFLSTSDVISMQSYHSKNDSAITMLFWATLSVSWHTMLPICEQGGSWGTPSQPQNGQKHAPNNQILLRPPPIWLVCSHIIVKTTMQSLCYLDLPWLCLGTLCHPSATIGDPLTAPNRPKTCPKQPDFPLSASNMISVQLGVLHRKIQEVQSPTE